MSRLTRRDFLRGTAGLLGASLLPGCRLHSDGFPGSIVGDTAARGHLLRNGAFPAPTADRRTGVAIVGGGIAGLSAAWWLNRSGTKDVVLLELEDRVGGNSQSGENSVSAYPWAAHYVPVPGREARYVHMLFEELGIIEGYDSTGLPRYNEFYLCAAPEERLYIHGRWQSGLVPQLGISAADQEQYRRFFAQVNTLKNARGSDGRGAFVVPIRESSRDARFLALDRESFSAYLDRHGFTSPALRWYLNYCCLDDYGTPFDQVSAWAGMHYFASRSAWASGIEDYELLTWPEGNGWIVKRLQQQLGSRITSAAVVYRVEPSGPHYVVSYFDPVQQQSIRLHAKAVIYAAPRFTAPWVIKDYGRQSAQHIKHLSYSPWMVANLTLSELPERRPGELAAWDNVVYESASLGYVVATHQSLRQKITETVITYYLPLAGRSPVDARTEASTKSHDEWCREIVADLSIPHPKIERAIRSIDVRVMGHAMIRPTPDFIWNISDRLIPKRLDNIFFAHSDMSGISIFEEAQYHGIQAAEGALRALRI